MRDPTTELTVNVGADALLRLSTALRGLITYPYGCTEQTVSRLMPLYVLREHHSLIDQSSPLPVDLDRWIQNGIDRLWAAQTATGGLSFWAGGTMPDPYCSVYALHFLTLVRNDRQYRFSQANYDQLRDYVWRLTNGPVGRDYYTHYLRAYAVYALALSGDQRAMDIVRRYESIELTESTRYLFAAALAVATRDGDRVEAYLRAARMTPFNWTEEWDAFSSKVRDDAVRLMMMVSDRRRTAGDGRLAQDLTHWLESGRSGSGQLRSGHSSAPRLHSICSTSARMSRRAERPSNPPTASPRSPGRSSSTARGRVVTPASS